jgi:heme exporter protein CcmD
MSEFLHMGGYARFVWPSYGLTLAIVVLNIVWARASLARAASAARRRLMMKGEPP